MVLKRIDVGVVTMLPILAAVVTVVEQPALLVSVVMFFGVPSAYLAIRNPGILKKSLVFAFVISVPLSLFVDTLAAIDKSWIVPQSLFPFRFFGLASVEVYLFSFLWVLHAILFYEHFFDGGRRDDQISVRIRYLIYLSIALVSYVIWGILLDPAILSIRYFYALVSIVLLVIPLFLFLIRYPIFWRNFLLVQLYFFFLLLLFEMGALTAGQWTFPGTDYIGWISVFGLGFPLEELVFWMSLATASLLAYYEFFGDDLRKSV